MPSAAGLRVLVVDDQPSMRELARYCLEQIGVREIEDCADGSEALDLVARQDFDLIISDWMMKDVDGLTLLNEIRANPLLRRTPFIMATGQSEHKYVAAAVQAGASSYLIKPFNVATLRRKIESVIGRLV